MSMKSHDSRASAPPRGEGSSPRRASASRLAAALAIVVAPPLGTPACEGGHADQIPGPLVLGMTSAMAPSYSDGNTTIYEAQRPVPLPVRRPSSSEVSGAPPKGTAYSHAPYLLASDESIEVHYIVTNVDDTMHAAWLLVD